MWAGRVFGKNLLERVDQQGCRKGGAAAGHRGSRTIRAEPRQMLGAGLRALGLRTGDLATLPKGQREKLVLAWWLYGQTTV